MATLRKRGERWRVHMRRKGSPIVTRSSPLGSDAQAWARASRNLRLTVEVSLPFTRVSVASQWPTSRLALAGAGTGEQGRQISSRFRRKVVAVLGSAVE